MLVAVKTPPCVVCNEWSTVIVHEDDYGAWISGVFIQDAFPYLSSTERELLMTGTCEACWDSMFGDDMEDIGAEI